MTLYTLPKQYHPDWASKRQPNVPMEVDKNHPLAPTHGFWVCNAQGILVNLLTNRALSITGSPQLGVSGNGKFLEFNNPNTTSEDEFIDTIIDDTLSTYTIAAGVDTDSNAVADRYYHVISKGSVFSNSTNFAFGLRLPTATIFSYSRSSGGSLSGQEANISSGFTFNKYITIGSIWNKAGDINSFLNGDNVNTGTGKTLHTSGTQDVRIGAGTNQTSNDRGFQDKLYWVYLSETVLSDAQMRSLQDDPYQILKPKTPPIYFTPAGGISVTVTGTAVPTQTEADIVTGGKTIILTLTGDTFVTGTSSEDGIAAGSDSDITASGTNWDSLIKTALDNTDVVLSSGDTVATITLPAFATYDIPGTETITWTIPAASLTIGTSPVIATPTHTITAVVSGVSIPVIMHSYRLRRA